MQENMMEILINELLEEQKLINKNYDRLGVQMEDLTMEVKGFEKLLTQVKVTALPPSTLRIETLIANHFQSVNSVLSEIKQFVITTNEKKKMTDIVYEWLPWLLIVGLCAVIFQIAIGGTYHGSIF